MLRFLTITVLALVFLSANRAGAEEPKVLSGKMKAKLEALLGGFPGVSPALSGIQVAVIQDGTLRFSDALGFARVGANSEFEPLLPYHRMRVASLSKVVVALGVMQLVEAGQLNLSDDISLYFDFPLRNPTFPDIPITVEHVLSHTSSIRDGSGYALPYGQTFRTFFGEESEHFTKQVDQEPGVYFTYANLNFAVLAGIIERVSGERFDRFMVHSLLKPLGLDTGFSACHVTRTASQRLVPTFRKQDDTGGWDPHGPWRAQNDGDTVACYVGMAPTFREIADTKVDLSDYTLGTNPTLFSPQGGLRASAEDLAKIMTLFLGRGKVGDKRLLKGKTIDDMLQTRWRYTPLKPNGHTVEGESVSDAFSGLMTRYGLSIHIIDLQDWGLSDQPRLLYGHLGEAYGLLGGFWFDPKTGDGFVSLITGMADDPTLYPGKSSPLYAPEEALLRWWLTHFGGG